MTDMPTPANDAAKPADAPVDADRAPEPDAFAVIEKLNAENAELKDRVLRTLAEMENLRRRTEREVADARTYGVQRLAKDMLEFADNLARARANIPADAQAAVAALTVGLEAIERNFVGALGRHGVKKLDPKGQKFDPHRHEALFEVPDPSVPSGTVAQVIEDGYTLGERTLRPAKVGVARGGPAAESAKPEGGADAA